MFTRRQLSQRLRRASDSLSKVESQIAGFLAADWSQSTRAERDSFAAQHEYNLQHADKLRQDIATLRAAIESTPPSPNDTAHLRATTTDLKRAVAGMIRLADGDESHPAWEASFMQYAQRVAANIKALRQYAAQRNNPTNNQESRS